MTIKLRQLINESEQSYREVTMYATYTADSPANHRGHIFNPVDKGMTLDIKPPFNPPYNGSLGRNNRVIYCAPFKWMFNDENENVDLIHVKFKVSLDKLFIDKEEFHYWEKANMYDELEKIDWDHIETYADLVSEGIKFNNPWDIAGCYVKTINPEQILGVIFELTRTKYFKNGGEEKKKRIDLQRIQEYIKNGSQGTLDLTETPLTKLPDNLTKVGGDLLTNDSNIEDLNNLEYVGTLCLDGTNVDSLPEGLEIGGYIIVWNTPLKKRFSDKSSLEEYLKERHITVKKGISF